MGFICSFESITRELLAFIGKAILLVHSMVQPTKEYFFATINYIYISNAILSLLRTNKYLDIRKFS